MALHKMPKSSVRFVATSLSLHTLACRDSPPGTNRGADTLALGTSTHTQQSFKSLGIGRGKTLLVVIKVDVYRFQLLRPRFNLMAHFRDVASLYLH